MRLAQTATHFAALAIISILCSLIYVTVQQSHRSGANDPQLQLALDLKNAIENSKVIPDASEIGRLDLSKSLSVFTAVYDPKGEPIESTGSLNGELPKMPKGVFVAARKNREHVVTWQPQRGVRLAMVVEAVNAPGIGFVAAGRSLTEVEKREANLTKMVFVAWLTCIGIVGLHFLLQYFTSKNSNK